MSQTTGTRPSATEILERECPYYLLMGMSLDEYWHSNPYLAVYYREAHKLHIEQNNYEAWLSGLYFHHALNVSLANVFSRKGAKKQTYMDKPLSLNTGREKTEAQKNIERDKEREKARVSLENLKKMIEARNQNKGVN